MFRFLIYEDTCKEAYEALDNAGIPYDFDSGDRVMIEDEFADKAVSLWDKNGINYDKI